MIKIAKTRGTKNSYSVLFIKLSLHDKPPPLPMNYLHTPPTKIVRQFVNFRFIFPKMAASLFGLSLIVLSFTVTISPRYILLKIQYGTICK